MSSFSEHLLPKKQLRTKFGSSRSNGLPCRTISARQNLQIASRLQTYHVENESEGKQENPTQFTFQPHHQMVGERFEVFRLISFDIYKISC
ncbi:hypothetical protein AVEN_221445-1 [Araneus ventricosus]|uniref:Uncharacterized protein n=1 Tax=Araneus ventricosus TaxID=182803 RepID=A0A4Y2N4I7_ARAVE|nr:hypothetical protein AVEN_221445-1 [Araneus ventricosus]